MINIEVSNAADIVPQGYSHLVFSRVSTNEKRRSQIERPGKKKRYSNEWALQNRGFDLYIQQMNESKRDQVKVFKKDKQENWIKVYIIDSLQNWKNWIKVY